MSSPTQHEWQEMEQAWVTRALVAERKLCALQSSHKELVAALTAYRNFIGSANFSEAPMDIQCKKSALNWQATVVLANAAKLAPTKVDGKEDRNV